MNKNMYFYTTKLGDMCIAEFSGSITHLTFDKKKIPSDYTVLESETIKRAYQQLCEYFEGKRKDFDMLLAPEGTEFQKKVWKNLCKIPYGKTWSYKELARAAGNEKACRAVGGANNKNPICIVIPCHRVIGANGALVGYAGGLDIKKGLLEIEHANI